MDEQQMIEALEAKGYTDVSAVSDDIVRAYGFSAIRPDGEPVRRQILVSRDCSGAMLGYLRQGLIDHEHVAQPVASPAGE